MAAPFPDRPDRVVASPDGTPIAVFSAAGSFPDASPLVLVHGTTADHRTWRVVGPALARRFALHAIDRRGRGDSGDGGADGRTPYAIVRELEDLAAVAEALAAEAGRRVDVVGHSLGGRIALGASLRTRAIRRVVAYEGAPSPPGGPPDDLRDRLRADLAAGDLAGLLTRFMTSAVGMTPGDLDRFRADPVWPLRVAAAPTIVRELEGADDAPELGLEALARITAPVLQLVGSDSPARFGDGARALDARLADGRLVTIDGARHAAHHSHPDAFVEEIERFLLPAC